MKTYLIFLVLFVVGAQSREWEVVKKTQEVLAAYRRSAEDVISVMEEAVRNSTEDSLSFWESIEEWPFLKEGKTLRADDPCFGKYIDTKELKSSFKLTFSGLENEVLKRKLDVQGRFMEVISALSVFKDLADLNALKCQAVDSTCIDDVRSWIQEKMEWLMCKVIPDCKKHIISKRYSRRDSCGNDNFRCSSGNCISGSYACDGSCNCNSCDDEPTGCKRTCFGGFHCRNLRCIEKLKVCDGVDDCGDKSDEESCTRTYRMERDSNCTLETGGFLCDDGRCVHASQVCDGTKNCGDGSDEGGDCSKSICEPVCSSAGGVCFVTPKGPLCLSGCPSGTTETPLGCLPGPQLPPATISELLEDVPRVLSRYMSSLQLLQRRVIDKITNSLSEVADCRSQTFASIGKLIKMKIETATTTDFTTTSTTEDPTGEIISTEVSTPSMTTSEDDYLEYS